MCQMLLSFLCMFTGMVSVCFPDCRSSGWMQMVRLNPLGRLCFCMLLIGDSIWLILSALNDSFVGHEFIVTRHGSCRLRFNAADLWHDSRFFGHRKIGRI